MKNLPINKINFSPPLIMKWLLVSVTIFLIILTLIIIFAFSYAKAHSHDFFPGVTINGQPLKNLSHAQALEFWQNKVDDFVKQGLKYKFNDQAITIFPTLPATDPDVSYDLIHFEVLKTVDQAYLYGRQKGYSRNFLEQLKALAWSHNVDLEYQLDQAEFLGILKNNFSKFTAPKLEAKPLIDDQLNLEIQTEAAGTTFDYQEILNSSLLNIRLLSNEPIVLNLQVDEPAIKKSDLPDLTINRLKDLAASQSLTLVYREDSWAIGNEIFKNWFEFRQTDGKISIGLDASTTKGYLKEAVAPAIYQATLDAKFDIKNGRVIEFQGSSDGRTLNLEKSFEKLEHDFLIEGLTEIELTVEETKAKVTTGSVNDLGIGQLLGTGQSNFKGSPKNRRHNIAVGAQALNGLLIKPGEIFSLIKALGEISKDTGYLPELVIKGDETIPEYGGGLCQIGTTVFRAALAAGLPIVERRNHSYRVVYYEPAGKDATIYDPKPDFKFTNDTPANILIQTRIEGDNLYFDFWGTSDGRIAEQSDSVIYNIKPPGETVYIETDKLEPDAKQCTESAHAGADAYFDYRVTYPDGTVQEERFTSHYIPWPAKCLIGKAPQTASSTEEIIGQ